MKLSSQIAALTIITMVAIVALYVDRGNFLDLWLTRDQQGRLAFESLDFSEAADLFENPSWQGTAAYSAGRYQDAVASFSRSAPATSFYNRGNALMKARKYREAITSFQQAVDMQPDWFEASENLKLATYVRTYIEGVREQSDTGDETELGADGVEFDNETQAGKKIVITRESTIALESAQKWMRAVDTQTREFLRIRFAIQVAQNSHRESK